MTINVAFPLLTRIITNHVNKNGAPYDRKFRALLTGKIVILEGLLKLATAWGMEQRQASMAFLAPAAKLNALFPARKEPGIGSSNAESLQGSAFCFR